MGRLEGKVALITGAARGQGRSHALRLAADGADIIALDLCEQVDSVPYAMSTEADLAEAVRAVEALDRRVVAAKVDVRDAEALDAATAAAIDQLGGLDIVCVNAGIVSAGPLATLPRQAWKEVLDTNLTGAFNTVQATVPHLIDQHRGGSVIFTSSTLGLQPMANLGHYNASKHGIIGLMQTLALELGPEYIRVNAVCPANVDTPMIQNDWLMKLFFPGSDHPKRQDAEAEGSPYRVVNAIPEPWLDASDISNAVAFLASDEARFITGVALPVDLGRLLT